jgi:hypothetical protein
MLRADHTAKERRSARRIEGALKHLSQTFGLDRAVDISADRIARYVDDRRKAGAANGPVSVRDGERNPPGGRGRPVRLLQGPDGAVLKYAQFAATAAYVLNPPTRICQA